MTEPTRAQLIRHWEHQYDEADLHDDVAHMALAETTLAALTTWTCETCHLDNNGATCTECGMTPAEAR